MVSTTGKASANCLKSGRRVDRIMDMFFIFGSMGYSSFIALGIAINKSDIRTWCIDGDGSALMHLGTMPVIGANAPENLIHVVINNGAHETVGGMPTVAEKIDLVKITERCGYPYAVRVRNYDELDREIEAAVGRKSLVFIEVMCAIGSRKNLGRSTSTPMENTKAFMEQLSRL